ncbi:uncharacterized protein LOC129236183 [Anastrepha obliqua]|uniref:uncharacterized protein LOC129236183 n=1 Tax=Anastrepha obliqua TaxID=95512 RepID=UPI00240A2747|nr:uncharacterized protein LOC129236183 [Anastrepha obliqua]
MDDIKQLLQHNGLQYVLSESSSASESEESTISAFKIGQKVDQQGRMPTRRPNPNVHNRNALLARENRRKKKAHLEAMEKELEEVRAANKHLKKALKQQMKAVEQLQREKRYFQSVITNHKEIENLIKALNVRMHVQQSSNANSPMLSSPGYGDSSPSSNISQHVANMDKGLQNDDFVRNPLYTSDISNNDLVTSSICNDTWSDILDEDFQTADLAQLTTVTNEHSYAELGQMISSNSTGEDAGICLHIRQGEISLEFCPSCSWNANNNSTANILQN